MVRLKHRYLLLEILYPTASAKTSKKVQDATSDVVKFHAPSPPTMDAKVLVRMMRESIETLFGDYGMGKVFGSLKVIYFSSATSTAIVRVSRDHVRMVWAALSFVTKLEKPFNDPCVIHVVRNSGTIRLAEEEAIKHARDFVRRARSSAQGLALHSVLKSAVETEERETRRLATNDGSMSDDFDD